MSLAGAIADGGLVIVPTLSSRQVWRDRVPKIVEQMRLQIVEADIAGWPGVRLGVSPANACGSAGS